MMIATTPLALVAGPSWWRLLGALLLVVGLLLLTLRLLQRWQGGRARAAEAALLAVHRVGTRRDLEMIRWREQVYLVYRAEGSAVLLDREPFDAARHLPPATAGHGWRSLLGGARGDRLRTGNDQQAPRDGRQSTTARLTDLPRRP